MLTIIKINPWTPKDSDEIKRYYIDFENGRTEWVHPVIYNIRDLKEGMVVDVEELLRDNEHKWRTAYNNGSWEEEKVRISAVKDFIKLIRNDINIDTVGFGANSNEIIYAHSKEQGSPDLDVLINNYRVAKIEVSGSKIKRGTDYWVRPDKIEYIQNNPNENVWIILHYQSPSEMVFIKVDLQKNYKPHKKIINGNVERYVIFDHNSTELKSQKEFINEVLSW